MWVANSYKNLNLNLQYNRSPQILFYSPVFYFILHTYAYKRLLNFVLIPRQLIKKIKLISFETRNIRFRYIGKAYRISKKSQILVLNLHYPTFKYIIWSNLKLAHKKKRRKIFKFKYLTSSNLLINLFQNLFKLRIPDTYTKRGIINNLFYIQSRKQKAATNR